MKNYITFLYSLFLSYSQTIKGEITNGNQAIPFANISIKGIDKGAAADLDGRFILNNVPEGKQEIVVSAIGYNKYKATFIVKAGLNVYNFVLEESSFELDQVVSRNNEGKFYSDVTCQSRSYYTEIFGKSSYY